MQYVNLLDLLYVQKLPASVLKKEITSSYKERQNKLRGNGLLDLLILDLKILRYICTSYTVVQIVKIRRMIFLKLQKSDNFRLLKNNYCFKIFKIKSQYKNGFSYSLKTYRCIYFHAFALGQQLNGGNPGEYERPGVRGPADHIGKVFAYKLKDCGFESLFLIYSTKSELRFVYVLSLFLRFFAF